jgi:hypothetical protein
MRKGLRGIFAIWIVSSTPLMAQTASTPTPPKAALGFQETASDAPALVQTSSTPTPPKAALGFQNTSSNAPALDFGNATADIYRFWARGEYLLWWVKNTPTPPLVTTGSSNDAFPGAIGQPSTRVLFGGSADYGATSGGRFSLGGWLDCEHTIGLEASGFLLERRSVGFNAASDPSGNPPLYLPLFRADLGHEGVYRISDPVVGLNGGVAVNSQMRLWGAEANGVFNAWRRNGLSIDLLAGFRYVDLAETLTIQTNSTDFVNQINDVTYDRFSTRNQFYGGQVGARAALQYGRLSLELAGKVALGANHETVNVNGTTTETGVGSANPGTFPGGVFAQPSNIGQASRNQFAVIPEGQFKVGYQLRPNIRATVGYDILYWNEVVRPGSQMDRNVNPTQSLGGTLVGPPLPAPQFNRTDFWAQGVSFGLEFRY